ncbi:PC3-like endoprotease variant B [Argonauta hians]
MICEVSTIPYDVKYQPYHTMVCEVSTIPYHTMVTTGLHGSCTEHFAGTSAAAPLAAGCIALVLQANPLLTWRDAQHIVVRGARMTPIKDSWSKNGAGIHFSNSFGFGVMDCSRMVELAEDWQNVPVALNHSYSSRVLERKISYATPIVMNVSFSGDSLEMNHLEHVQLYIKLQHSCRGEVQIFLTSPSATKSQMLSPRKLDCSKDGIDFHFLSVYYWDEDPQGNWKLQVFDTQDNDNNGVLIEWKIILHGYMKDMKVNTSGSKLTPEDIRPIIKGENSVTKSVNVFSPKLEIKHNLRPVKRTKGNRLSESYKPESIMTRQIKFGNPNVEVESYNKQKLNKGGDNTFSKKRSFLWRLTELQQTDERDINIQSKSFYQRLRLKSMMSSESLKNGKIDIFSWVSNFKVCKDKANNLARNINCNYFNRLYRLLIELMNTNNSQQNFSNKNVFHLKNSNNKFNISTTKSNSLRYRQVGKYIAERMLHKDDTSGATISPQHKPKPSIGEVKSQVDDKILLGNIIKRLRQLIHIEYNIEYVKDSVSLKSSDIARNLNKIDVKNTKVQHSDNNTYQNTWNKLFSMKKEPMLEEELQVLQLQQSERL